MSLSAKEICLADALGRIEEMQRRVLRDEADLEALRQLAELLLAEQRLLREHPATEPKGGYVRAHLTNRRDPRAAAQNRKPTK